MSENLRGFTIVIGAGGTAKPWLDQSKAEGVEERQILLIEPLPEQASQLRRSTQGYSNIAVIEAAITAKEPIDGREQLHTYSWRDACSLHESARLTEIYPGLRYEGLEEVGAISLGELLAGIHFDEDHTNHLIIDAPGEGPALLNELVTRSRHTVFEVIDLKEPTDDLYRKPCSTQEAIDGLIAAGFNADALPASDPDWMTVRLTANPWKLRYQSLAKEFDAQARRLEALEKTKIEVVEERDKRAAKYKKLKKRMKATEHEMKAQAAENADLQRRQELMNEELSKAEAQVELIKDLLFKQTEEKA